jgi:predicted ATPase
LERAISLYDPQKRRFPAFQDPGVGSLSTLALALRALGYPEQALKRIRESVRLAQELSHPYSLADAFYYAGEFYHLRRDVRATREHADAAIALSREHGFTLQEARSTVLRGWALAKQGDQMKGIAQIRQGLAAARAVGTKLWEPVLIAQLAETCGDAGQPEEGLTALADVNWDRPGPELYGLKGELLLMRDESSFAEAEGCFRRAIEIAHEQSAKSWELRVTVRRVRLLAKQGRRNEARVMLGEIYSWFTEGFDTADLKDAKALLDELSN